MAPVRHHPAHLGAGAGILGCIFLSWLVLLAGIAACQRQSKSCPPRNDTRHLLVKLIWSPACTKKAFVFKWTVNSEPDVVRSA